MRSTFFTFLFVCWGFACVSVASGNTFFVNLPANAGLGTLRQAIADANPGDTIRFDLSINGNPIILASGPITIDKSLTILGNGPRNTIISGNRTNRIFTINDGSITISGIKFINGRSLGSGGALYVNDAVVSISDCHFIGNIAEGDAPNQGGGAIYNIGGTVNIDGQTLISGNVAEGESGSGGGILNDTGGTLNVLHANFVANRSNRAGGAIEDNSGSATTISVDNSSFARNSTGSAPGNGGAIHITGAGNAFISGVIFKGNSASAEGGGIWNGTGTMVIDSSLITGNKAGGAASDQGGGGVFNAGGILIIENETYITYNIADGRSGSGGGILNDDGGTLAVFDSYISANQSERAGGGVEDNSGISTAMTFSNTVLDKNITKRSPGYGGGLHITGPGNLVMTGGRVAENSAGAEGGGLWNGTGEMAISNVVINGNRASGAAADQGGGGVFNAGGLLIVADSTVISENIADGIKGSGGGIFNDLGGALTVLNSTISKNKSNRAGGGIEDNSGGATIVQIENSLFTGNHTGAAPGNGGAIHITGPGNMDILDTKLVNNSAVSEGGALWNGNGRMNVINTTIDGNTASGWEPNQGGGGIFNNGGTLQILTSTLSNNQTDGRRGSGGGLHNSADGLLTLFYTTVSGNYTRNDGGGIFNNGTLVGNGLTITENTARDNGGGVALSRKEDVATFKSSILAGNKADSRGDDIIAFVGEFISLGFNLIGRDDFRQFPALTTDMEGTRVRPIDPMLEPLAKNGGPTRTHALRCSSPAIDSGDQNNAANDQRDLPLLNQRDIGAFELQMECKEQVKNMIRHLGRANETFSNKYHGSLVYPNPAATNSVQVHTPAEFGPNIKVRIIEPSSGRTLHQETLSTGTTDLALGLLPAGNYLVQIIGDSLVAVHKLVVVE